MRKVFRNKTERCARVRSWIMAIMNFKQQFYLKRAFRPFLLYMQSTTSYTMGTMDMGVANFDLPNVINKTPQKSKHTQFLIITLYIFR